MKGRGNPGRCSESAGRVSAENWAKRGLPFSRDLRYSRRRGLRRSRMVENNGELRTPPWTMHGHVRQRMRTRCTSSPVPGRGSTYVAIRATCATGCGTVATRRTVSQHGGGSERSLIRSSMRGRFRQSGRSPRHRPSHWCETKRACSGSAQWWRSSFRFGAPPAARACSRMAAGFGSSSAASRRRCNCDWETIWPAEIDSPTRSRRPARSKQPGQR